MNKNRSLAIKLPTPTIQIRPMRHADVNSIAQWIYSGRKERAFAHGQAIDTRSLLQYQKSFLSLGWQYMCFVIEKDEKPIGYFDLQFRQRKGEILGIYVLPPFRGKGIGKLAIRWAVALLKNNNCRKISALVFEGNIPSQKMLAASGFFRVKDHQSQEQNRKISKFIYTPTSHPRLSKTDSSYLNLRGNNLIFLHEAVADIIVQEMQKVEGVQMILGLGSLARGFADEYSDIDLAVIGSLECFEHLWVGERWIAGISVDVFGVDPVVSPPEEWDLSRKQAFEESVVLYASDKSILKKVRKALQLTKSEQTYLIVETVLKLGWLGFKPPSWHNKKRFGYRWSLPHDLWIKRGSMEAAHSTIDQAFDLIMQLLYLINGKRVPDIKWRWFCISNLDWLPAGFMIIANRLQAMERNNHSFSARNKLLMKLVTEIYTFLIKKEIITGDIYSLYLTKSEDYNPKCLI